MNKGPIPFFFIRNNSPIINFDQCGMFVFSKNNTKLKVKIFQRFLNQSINILLLKQTIHFIC